MKKMQQQPTTTTVTYNDTLVRYFSYATTFWGIVGMLVGVLIATQMAFWQANLEPYLTFGRLRPLHTNAVIFAFVGNMIFAGVYYSTQRLLKTRMASDLLGKIHFWGWQLIIVSAAITLPLGITQSKEYAELEWPIDYAITFVWVVFAVNFFWTLKKRNEKHIYVAIWFYIASILTVAVLHIVNNLALPVSIDKSYSIFSGVQDALVQWWYGHNAVAFFLTTPVLGIMYYYVPKAVNRPVYSYRLSIIHFWALVFLYIWAGPHHLLYSALPDWAQNLGVVFSIALWAPSWGGMINGLLTIRGAWDKLRTDPVVKFFAAAITFYGMSTFEGPLLSVKAVNALAHNTDWIIGHVHGGALGWNGFMAAGMLYWLMPRLFNTKLYSIKLANFHFWIGLFGILLYVSSMWASGITQGLMWRALTDEGTLLYPNFSEAITKSQIMYMMRLVGGLMYFSTFVLMGYNLIKTIKAGKPVTTSVEVTPLQAQPTKEVSWKALIFSPTMFMIVLGHVLLLAFVTSDALRLLLLLTLVLVFIVACMFLFGFQLDRFKNQSWHHALEGKPLLFSLLTLGAILIGGMVQIIPAVTVKDAIPMMGTAAPYTPLQLAGRDLYIREGCNNCHTQMIRPFVAETLRYGAYSEGWEYTNDHPHLWGSKRTGPDLHRVGGKYPNLWHYNHMMDPRSTSPDSIMPKFGTFKDRSIKPEILSAKMKTLKRLGVPYEDQEIQQAAQLAKEEAMTIVKDLQASEVQLEWDSEMTAIIAYLQRLGTNRAATIKEPVQ
jgi:cytochrome c oxidase cbb3-type subunit I/II